MQTYRQRTSLHDQHHIAVARLPGAYDRLFEAFDIAWPRLLSTRGRNESSNDHIQRQLADVVLRFEGDNRSAAEIAEAALRKLGFDQA
jgi:hypothetical protein